MLKAFLLDILQPIKVLIPYIVSLSDFWLEDQPIRRRRQRSRQPVRLYDLHRRARRTDVFQLDQRRRRKVPVLVRPERTLHLPEELDQGLGCPAPDQCRRNQTRKEGFRLNWGRFWYQLILQYFNYLNAKKITRDCMRKTPIIINCWNHP